MSVAGIICEYNPFHEGHKYHIQKVRELTGADTVVAVMSGDFVQRGEPAIVDKYTRTRMALSEGADLVFELPVRYTVSSAEDFAYGGILALDSLSFVDHYCFGSECGDVDALKQAGRFLAQDPHRLQGYQASLSRELKGGLSYPAAREKAFWEHFQGEGKAEGRSELFAPNNTLGIEYIKAAVQMHSHMEPVVVQRLGMGYNEVKAPDSHDEFLSATAIRGNMGQGDFTGIPPAAGEILRQADCFLRGEDFWTMCSYAIRSRWEELERIKDISAEIASRFRSCWYDAVSLADFENRCKTKNITMSRIRRCVFQVLLGVEKVEEREPRFPYIRLLGMRADASAFLKKVPDTIVLGRLSRDIEQLGERDRRGVEQDIRASDLYRSVAMSVSGRQMPEEYKRPLITL